MKPFMNADFLLTTPTARHLYHDIAAEMPIIDYHCHIDPREIAEDRKFDNNCTCMIFSEFHGNFYKCRH